MKNLLKDLCASILACHVSDEAGLYRALNRFDVIYDDVKAGNGTGPDYSDAECNLYSALSGIIDGL